MVPLLETLRGGGARILPEVWHGITAAHMARSLPKKPAASQAARLVPAPEIS